MRLRLVLGDQLTVTVSSLADATSADLILICEARQEATYVKHHKKKIVFRFSAMRHFAQDLIRKGFNVHYVTYDDPEHTGSLCGEIARLKQAHALSEVIVTSPGEHRLLAQMRQWSAMLDLPVTIRPDDRFLWATEDFAAWAEGRT